MGVYDVLVKIKKIENQLYKYLKYNSITVNF